MKRFGFGLLFGLLTGLLLTATLAFAENPIKILVNGREIASDPAPMMYQDRVFVPVRFVSEALGYKVNWQEGTVAIDNTQQPVKTSENVSINPQPIKVIGDLEFTKKINAALDLLKQQSPNAYLFIQKNIKEIRLAENTKDNTRDITKILVGENSLLFFNSYFGFIPEGEESVLIASTIVRETCRMAQKTDETLSIFPDKDSDLIANLMQYRVAQQLGASSSILDPIKTRIQDNLNLSPSERLTFTL